MTAAKERLFVFAACFVLAAVGLAGDGMASPLGALAIAAVLASVVTATLVICDRRDGEQR